MTLDAGKVHVERDEGEQDRTEEEEGEGGVGDVDGGGGWAGGERAEGVPQEDLCLESIRCAFTSPCALPLRLPFLKSSPSPLVSFTKDRDTTSTTSSEISSSVVDTIMPPAKLVFS